MTSGLATRTAAAHNGAGGGILRVEKPVAAEPRNWTARGVRCTRSGHDSKVWWFTYRHVMT